MRDKTSAESDLKRELELLRRRVAELSAAEEVLKGTIARLSNSEELYKSFIEAYNQAQAQ